MVRAYQVRRSVAVSNWGDPPSVAAGWQSLNKGVERVRERDSAWPWWMMLLEIDGLDPDVLIAFYRGRLDKREAGQCSDQNNYALEASHQYYRWIRTTKHEVIDMKNREIENEKWFRIDCLRCSLTDRKKTYNGSGTYSAQLLQLLYNSVISKWRSRFSVISVEERGSGGFSSGWITPYNTVMHASNWQFSVPLPISDFF